MSLTRQIKSSVTSAVSIVFNLRLDFRFKPLDLQQSYRLLIMRAGQVDHSFESSVAQHIDMLDGPQDGFEIEKT